MRTLLLIAVAFVAVAAAAVAWPLAVVSTGAVKAKVENRIGAWVGGSVASHGEPVVTLFPSPGIVVRDVMVSNGGGAGEPPLATIPSLRASLRVLPLLAGEVEVGTLTLERPQIQLVGGGDAWLRALLSDGAGIPAGIPGGEIVVRDGTVRYEDRPGGRLETATAVDLHLAWQRGGRAAGVTGRFAWRGKTAEIDMWLEDPQAMFAGSGSEARATVVVSTPQRGGADGVEAGTAAPAEPERPQPSPQRLAERLGIPLAPSRTFGPLQVSGTLTSVAGMLTLSDATVTLPDSTAAGALALRLADGRPRLRGSLAFDQLDLGRQMQAFLPRTLAELLALPTSIDWIAGADIDVWVSAEEAGIGGFRSTDVLTRLLVNDGRARFNLLNAGVADGRAQGVATAEPDGDGASLRLAGRLEGISVSAVGQTVRAALANPLIGTDRPPRGRGTATFEVAARGATVAAVIRSADGWFRGEVEEGSVGGADIVATLEHVAGGDMPVARGKPFIPSIGRTQFNRLTIRIAIASAVARIEQIHFSGDRFELGLSGRSNLDHGEVEGEGVARLFASGSPGARARPLVQLPFGVGGTLRAPVVAPGVPRIGAGACDAATPRAPAWCGPADAGQTGTEPGASADADGGSGSCTIERYLGAPFGLAPPCDGPRTLADRRRAARDKAR